MTERNIYERWKAGTHKYSLPCGAVVDYVLSSGAPDPFAILFDQHPKLRSMKLAPVEGVWLFRSDLRSASRVLPDLIETEIKPMQEIDYEKEVSVFDTQVGGNHYKDLAIQPVDYIMSNGLDFLQGNVVKYVTRYKDKNGLEDLKKARHYIDMIIERESRDDSSNS